MLGQARGGWDRTTLCRERLQARAARDDAAAVSLLSLVPPSSPRRLAIVIWDRRHYFARPLAAMTHEDIVKAGKAEQAEVPAGCSRGRRTGAKHSNSPHRDRPDALTAAPRGTLSCF